MSIEQILTAHTEAMNRLAAVLEKNADSAKGTAPAKTAGKPAAKPAAKKNTGPTVEDAATAVTTYLKAGDADARAVAKVNVGKIIEHFGADRFTTIPEEHRAESLDMLNDFVEGRTPEIFADTDDESGDEDSMV